MKEYLFYDEVSGEEFLVETDMKEKAYLCAYTYFEEPKFVREVSHWEAEMMGLDTYQLCVKLARAALLKNSQTKNIEKHKKGIDFLKQIAYNYIVNKRKETKQWKRF